LAKRPNHKRELGQNERTKNKGLRGAQKSDQKQQGEIRKKRGGLPT